MKKFVLTILLSSFAQVSVASICKDVRIITNNYRIDKAVLRAQIKHSSVRCEAIYGAGACLSYLELVGPTNWRALCRKRGSK